MDELLHVRKNALSASLCTKTTLAVKADHYSGHDGIVARYHSTPIRAIV